MVAIGNFLFKYRNGLFPLLILALFALARPPATAFGSEPGEDLKDLAAVAIVALGLVIRASVIGFAYIKRGGKAKRVYAENLVTGGMFGVTRNPLYVGNMLVYSGVFLMHGHPAVVALGILAFAFCYQCIVLAEEAYLADKFGAGYAAYRAEVPRWTLRLSRFRESTEAMSFNLPKVILNDYTTIANAVMMLSAAEIYEQVANGEATRASLTPLIAVIVASVLVVAAIAAYKKRAVIAAKFGY